MYDDITIAIERQILCLKQADTTGMTIDNLYQVTRAAWGIDRTTFGVLARDAAEPAGFQIIEVDDET